MTAFESAWDLVKDFYFDPTTQEVLSTRADGSILSFRDTLGNMQPPIIEGEYIDRIKHGSNYKLTKYPFVEGKHQPVILPRNVLMEHSEKEGGFAPRRIDSMRLREMYRGHEGLPHYLGVNLSAMRQGEDDLDTILETLAHEHAHAAIDDELMQVLYDRMLEAQSYEDAEKAYQQHVGAHEIGAYALQNPGGLEDSLRARLQTILHPNYKLANRGKNPPRAFIRDNLK